MQAVVLVPRVVERRLVLPVTRGHRERALPHVVVRVVHEVPRLSPAGTAARCLLAERTACALGEMRDRALARRRLLRLLDVALGGFNLFGAHAVSLPKSAASMLARCHGWQRTS